MLFVSTRGGDAEGIETEEAIVGGLAKDGGLYAPLGQLPRVGMDRIAAMAGMRYTDIAAEILLLFLGGFTAGEARECARAAYAPGKFDAPDVAPVKRLDANTYVLELYHGPTAAFKDMALQVLPPMLVKCLRKLGEKSRVAILTATSGDTGKAALEGFRDVPGTQILVFYPENGVSEVQKAQMVTQEGGNVYVSAVRGNFDDAQSGVKEIFSNHDVEKELKAKGVILSSANSINWGRLMPQIAYYFWAYSRLLSQRALRAGDPVRFCVPTGNFGNILAAWYARGMGLPVSKLVCASNTNHVLTDFINTGLYDRKRAFEATISPSMDILVSSNLERLLFELAGHDAEQVSAWMKELKETGRYDIGPDRRKAMTALFQGGFATEAQTKAAIADAWARHGYLMDTHTAVGYHVLRAAKPAPTAKEVTVLVSTASPYKFAKDVYEAIVSTSRMPKAASGGKAGGAAAAAVAENAEAPDPADEFSYIEALERLTGTTAPPALKALREKPRRHFTVTGKSPEDIRRTALELLLGGERAPAAR